MNKEATTTMTDKELRRLSRRELLQMLLEQTGEVERLQAELDKTRAELNDRAIMLESCGNIAEASLKINRVFEAAQQAAEQYLANVRRIDIGQQPREEAQEQS